MEERLERFWNIIEERIRIKEQKEKGVPFPWTSNEIFKKCFFPNIDRNDDSGTKYIIDYCVNKSDLEKVLAVFRYRLCSSNINVMEEIKHLSEKDSIRVLEELADNGKIFPGIGPYQRFVSPKGKSSKSVVIHDSVKLADLALKIIKSKEHWSIKQLTDVLLESCLEIHPVRFRLHLGEIVKDLSMLFCNIDENSECHLGPGALGGLQRLFKDTGINRINQRMEIIKENNKLNLVPHQIEGALCEYNKYDKIEKSDSWYKGRLYKGRLYEQDRSKRKGRHYKI